MNGCGKSSAKSGCAFKQAMVSQLPDYEAKRRRKRKRKKKGSYYD
jgi:hypothetical protein